MSEFPEQQLEDAIDDYRTFIQGGRPPSKAKERLLKLMGNRELVEKAVEKYEEQTQRFVEYSDPSVLTGAETIQSWYDGPDFPGAWCWPAYRKIVEGKGWREEAVEKLDESSTKIMAHLPHPGKAKISTRGMVVGYVQSGKTSNYSALISKAADVGYKLFIVLTGMTSSLRRQTQRRLGKEIVKPNSDKWNPLTSTTEDFQGVGNPDYLLNPKQPQGRILCVVKKNVFILQRLIDFFADADDQIKSDCPVLIIDDEADQASVNTEKKAEERSAINEKIVNLLQTLPKSAYVGYTATPFANVFIDPTVPENLYPRDFIFDLPKPKDYFGAEEIFGREMLRYDDDEGDYDGLDMIRTIPEAEASYLKPPGRDDRFQFQPEVTPSLEKAIRYFLLASAARLARGQRDQHTSMLVHTTLYTHTHAQLQTLIRSYVEDLADRWADRDDELMGSFEQLWKNENSRVTSGHLDAEVEDNSFEEIKPFIDDVFSRCEVDVDNGKNTGLDYDPNNPGAHIAIGGNTLSRGLTLEGLMVSFFVRTASSYDTLLQMGRWFGFRHGYEDLPRVWMTPELQDNFIHLATVEEEIRHDIRKYEKEGRSPLDFGVRVQTHPKLGITSRLKMQNVQIESASYSESHIQTIQFKHDDSEWLKGNLEATRELLDRASSQRNAKSKGKSRWVYRDVPVEHVLDFVRAYDSTHEDFRTDLLTNYIEKEREVGGLQTWNLGVVGSSNEDSIDLGVPIETTLVTRSRFKSTSPANIKALTTKSDRIMDLDMEVDLSSLTSAETAHQRNKREPDSGLLLIYPIDKKSEPSGDSGVRKPLDADEHVIGIGMSFPQSKREMRDYVANNLGDVYTGEQLRGELEEETDVEIRSDEQDRELEG